MAIYSVTDPKQKLFDHDAYDGVLSKAIPHTAVDDGVDRRSPCFTRRDDGSTEIDWEKWNDRMDRHERMRAERPGLALRGILANEVTFAEFFERDRRTGKPVRLFYCQVPMFLARVGMMYCGREVGKSWCIDSNSLHRATNFPGGSLLSMSWDQKHIVPRADKLFHRVDTHPFFSQLISTITGARRRQIPVKQDFINGFEWNATYPAREGTALERYHVDGTLCLDGSSRVTLEDGSTLSIREIVTHRIEARVLSLNHQTNRVESKRITDWHENPLGGRRMVRIGHLLLTEDHPVHTDRGYVPAGRIVQRPNLFEITEIDREVRRKSRLDFRSRKSRGSPDRKSILDFLRTSALDFRSGLPLQEVHTGLPQEETDPVYCIDVEDNHNFFADSYLVHNCDESQELSESVMQKWEFTQNDFRSERGSILKFFGVNAKGETDTPFYLMSFKDERYRGYVYRIPSHHNAIEYSLAKHRDVLKRYDGNVESPRFKQMVRGMIGEGVEGVFNQRHYENCTELRMRLSREMGCADRLPYRKRRFEAGWLESRHYHYPECIGAPLDLPAYDDLRLAMDFGFGGAPTIIEVWARFGRIWHLAENIALIRVPEPRQAEFIHHLVNREGTGIYPAVSTIAIDVTGNRNVYAYLVDRKDPRFNNIVNEYEDRLFPVGFERPVLVDKLTSEPPSGVRSKKAKLIDGVTTVWEVYEECVPFSTSLIVKRMAETGYSLPAEDDARKSEFMGMMQEGRKYFGYRGVDHAVASNRCLELSIFSKDTVGEIDNAILGSIYSENVATGVSTFVNWL